MKKILSILLTVCMVVWMIPVGGVFATEPAGTEADPILIKTVADLKEISTNDSGKYYRQENDITITSNDGYSAISSFAGHYNGNGKTITLDDENLFGTVSGTVKNLTVKGATATKEIAATGAIATTVNATTGVIEKCTVSGVTLTQSAAGAMGAIAGTSSGKIENCNASSVTLKNTAASGDVIMGGLVGTASGTVECGSTLGVTFNAPASGTTNKIGSVVGQADNALTLVSAKEIGSYPVIADASTNKVTIASSGSLKNALNIGTVEINNTTVNSLTGTTVDLNCSPTVTNLITSGSNPTLSMASSNVGTLTLDAGAKLDAYSGSHIGILNCSSGKTLELDNSINKLGIDKCIFTNTSETGLSNVEKLFNGDSGSYKTVIEQYNSTYTYTYTPVYAASIGSQNYYNLSDAAAYALANSGKTIKLLKDATGTITVRNGTALTFDANGYNLSLSSVTNYGSLVVTDTAATKGKITVSNVGAGSNEFCGIGNYYTNNPESYMLSGYTCEKVTPTAGNAYWQISDTKKDISNLTVTLSDTVMAYTGSQLKPTVTVKDGTKTVSSSDYTVTYGTNVGSSTYTSTGTVTVEFKDSCKDYRGTKTLTFTITPGKVLSSTTVYVPTISDQYYTGTYVKPTVYVYYGGATATTARTLLTEGVHYTVSYSSNLSVGTATVTVSAKAGSGYSGSITKTFAIKYNLSNATVTTTPSSYSYDGNAKKPAVTVKVGTTVVPASAYDVTYSDNTNVGTATVTVKAKTYGNAVGSSTAYFTISGKYGTITPEYAAYSYKTTKSNPFAIRIVGNTTDGIGYSYTSGNTAVAIVSSNGTVTTTGCGKTNITVKTTGNKAYYPASATVSVTVKPPTGKIGSVVSSSRGKMKVTFEKVAAAQKGTVRYQIRYSRDKDFDYGTYKTATFKSTKAEANASAKKTVSGLVSGSKYYVKVRGYVVLDDGTKVYGKWSKVKSVKVK